MINVESNLCNLLGFFPYAVDNITECHFALEMFEKCSKSLKG